MMLEYKLQMKYIDSVGGCAHQSAVEIIGMLVDALKRAQRLLSLCEFDALEDLSDYGIVMDVETEYCDED